MKAAKFIGNGRIEIIDKPVPQVREGEVLVKVNYCGLCGSEKRIVSSGFDKCTPGHEISGTVEVCGKTPAPFTKGARVLIYLLNYCGRCAACQALNTSQCTNRRGLVGWTFDGGYAEYLVVPDHMVFPIDDLALPLGVIALDTIGTAFHGLRQGDIRQQHSVLVLGCGPIGLGCISILKNYYGINSLYAADTSAYHCTMAERLGAQPIYVDPADTVGSVMAALGGYVDRVIEVVGLNSTVEAAFKCVCPGGKVVLIGEPEKALTITRSTDWVLKDFTLINSWYFPISELKSNLTYIRKHQTEMEELVTHIFPIEKITQAFEIFTRGETGKVLIEL